MTTLTLVSSDSGTIDITTTVKSLETSFVDWAVAYIYGEEVAMPGMQWVALPIIKDVDQAIIRAVVQALAESLIMEGFFISTAIRKASQAEDFVAAVSARANLPPTASEDDYAKAEQNQMAAFRNFVMVTN